MGADGAEVDGAGVEEGGVTVENRGASSYCPARLGWELVCVRN